MEVSCPTVATAPHFSFIIIPPCLLLACVNFYVWASISPPHLVQHEVVAPATLVTQLEGVGFNSEATIINCDGKSNPQHYTLFNELLFIKITSYYY